MEHKNQLNLKLEESVKIKDYLTKKISQTNQEIKKKESNFVAEIQEMRQVIAEQNMEKYSDQEAAQ